MELGAGERSLIFRVTDFGQHSPAAKIRKRPKAIRGTGQQIVAGCVETEACDRAVVRANHLSQSTRLYPPHADSLIWARTEDELLIRMIYNARDFLRMPFKADHHLCGILV